MKKVYVILHNIRSAHNVGAIFRTADAAGVSKMYLTGLTPAPVDRFGRKRKDVAKVSLGAEETVSWEARTNLRPLLLELKQAGAMVVAIEQDARSIDYKKIGVKKPLALIFGNEVDGIPKNILALSDRIAEIPLRGRMVRHAHHPRRTGRGKESLNVSVAAGIVLFSLLDR